MKKTNQRGFSIVVGLLVIIIVLLVGFIGYYVLHTQKATGKNNSNTANVTSKTKDKTVVTNPQTVSNMGNLVVKEWGVKIQSTNASDISYEYQVCPSANGCSSYGSNYESTINISNKYDSNGDDVVYRSQTKPVSENVNGKPSVDNYKKVGAYYYWTQGAYGETALDKNIHADLLNIVNE